MRALILFGKKRRLKFVSHLDLQRFFQRALNRADLPIAYSQGFNPHALMSFASALAMGWTSEYEVLDVKLQEPVSAGRVEEAMRGALPEDLPVLAVRLVDDRFPACMASVEAADYVIDVRENAETVFGAVPAYLAKEQVMGIRKTKSGEREIDLRPLTYGLEVRDGHIFARLALTERDTLKPDVLMTALADIAGVEIPAFSVHRTCLLARKSKTDFIPLMELKV